MNPQLARSIPWKLLLQYAVIVIAAFVMIRLISANFIGIIIGLAAGIYLTARHFRTRMAQMQAWHAYELAQYQQPQGYPPELTAGQPQAGQPSAWPYGTQTPITGYDQYGHPTYGSQPGSGNVY